MCSCDHNAQLHIKLHTQVKLFSFFFFCPFIYASFIYISFFKWSVSLFGTSEERTKEGVIFPFKIPESSQFLLELSSQKTFLRDCNTKHAYKIWTQHFSRKKNNSISLINPLFLQFFKALPGIEAVLHYF